MTEVPFTLRPWHISDLESLVHNANNKNIARFMTNQFVHPYTIECGQNFIDFATSENNSRIFCIDINGEAVGGIGLHRKIDIMSSNTELAYWLAEKHWGKGIVSSAITQALDIGFNEYNISRIFATVFGTNFGSQKALQKTGFVLEARFENTIVKDGVF
jgi:[ribosomal protein S5]-alanine N-acetyltransferase